MKCATERCERDAYTSPVDPTLRYKFCDDCTGAFMRTGRPPVLPVKFVPAWLRHAKAKDLTDRSAA